MSSPQGATDAAWRELCAATTELGQAAARWELARVRYVELARDHPRSGPPPAGGGAPTAPDP